MIARDIRNFVTRDWAAARERKDAYWAERIQRLGPAEAWRIADELRRQALHDPAWPASTRQDDLRSHIQLAGLFHRAGSARRR